MKIKSRLVLCCMGLLFAGIISAQTPEWQAGVDKVKELVKSNPGAAWETAESLLKGKNKKNLDLLLALANVYFEDGKTTGQEMEDLLDKAHKADKKDPRVSMLEGDIALSQKNAGKACQLYEQAIYFDKNCYEAYLKYARAYKSASPAQAIAKLQELKEVAPDYLPADKALAEVYYANNRFDEAVKSYARFIHTDVATEDDIINYAFALFLNHDFEASLEIARKGLDKNNNHRIFNRLALYNTIDLKRYDEANTYADKFFNQLKDVNYSGLDYRYYGALLDAQKQYLGAVDQYKKALELDTAQVELWANISEAYENNNDYAQAIDAYKKYCETLAPEENTMQNTFQLGRLYYSEGTSTDSVKVTLEMRAAALQEADTIFAQVAIAAPESYLGNFWRARTRSAMDPETTAGLAKPFYEKELEMMLAKNDARYNSSIIECYRYLGYYFLLQSDYPASKDYWNKILALDPENELAKRALEGIAQEGH